jgi:aminoglycoside phosphotransferase family enzyme/predicted kinase
MTEPDGQHETIALLRHLAGAAPIETPISLVFVGADTVWKLRKAVRLPFLDFTRVEDRRRFADREFALNAAAAPGLYRDVVPVVRGPDGTLALDAGGGTPIDWVLRMAPVPRDDFLNVMAAQGRLDPAGLDALADAVAAYHVALPPAQGMLPPMRHIACGNAEAAQTAGLPPDQVEAWLAGMLRALGASTGWMDRRAAHGFVRRAHGDLHLGNFCLWQGRPVPFDALEFDESMATIDLGYDLAFLLMDLDQRLNRAAANRVMNRYVARTGDAGLLRGLPVFLSMRAMVRAHVAARTGQPEEAAGYLAAASAYLAPRPPVVLAVGGLPGTGKSTLARALGPALGPAPGALILRSDEIRKRQFGVAPEQRLPPAAYGAEASEAVFSTLIATAAQAAADGHAVIADATFLDPVHRVRLSEAVRPVPFRGLWLHAPLPLLQARVAARRGDASDATVAVLLAAARNDPGVGDWHPIDTADTDAADPDAVLGEAQNWK